MNRLILLNSGMNFDNSKSSLTINRREFIFKLQKLTYSHAKSILSEKFRDEKLMIFYLKKSINDLNHHTVNYINTVLLQLELSNLPCTLCKELYSAITISYSYRKK